MPKAPAQDRIARKERRGTTRLLSLGRAFVFVIALGMVLSLFADNAEARRAPWYSRRNYTLNLSMSFDYHRSWNNRGGKYSDFTQSYVIGHTGYVFDPRLVTYGMALKFSNNMAVEGNGQSSNAGFSLGVTLFEGINRDRGISMWKYVPSPIGINYSFNTAFGGRTSQAMGINMYYTRPGTLRVFSNRKIIAYDDGTKKNINLRRNLNGNRYRYKYNNSNYNVNSNASGNANWNRNRNANGNANWNANGYVNRNRNSNVNSNANANSNTNLNLNVNVDSNGNANWNKNGNANWNKNGNSNWNRNGNANWNKNGNANWNKNWNRNWNRNWNYNNNYGRRAPGEGLFSFAYPHVSLDIHRYMASGGGLPKDQSMLGNLRIFINNQPRIKDKKIVYKSEYKLNYNYRDTNRSGTRHRLVINSSHRWSRFILYNTFSYLKLEDNNEYFVDSRLSYGNTFRIRRQPVNYSTGIEGNYFNNGDASSWDVTAAFITRTARSKLLMPGLRSSSSIDSEYRRKQNKAGDSDSVYGFTLRESLLFTLMRNTKVYGSFSAGYNESGIPASGMVHAVRVINSKLKIHGGYSVSTRFLTEHRGRTMTHRLWFGTNYHIRPNMVFDAEISHLQASTANGVSDSSSSTGINAKLAWQMNSRSTLDLDARYDFGDSGPGHMHFGVQYRARLRRSANLYIYGRLSKTVGRSDAEKFVRATYSVQYRKLNFRASYQLTMNPSGLNVHELRFNVQRSFGRTFSRLWGRR